MTSNSSPYPFSCYGDGNDGYIGSYWQAFNNNVNDGYTGGSNHDYVGESSCILDFGGKIIKPKKILINVQNGLSSAKRVYIYAERRNGTILASSSSGAANKDIILNVTQDIEVSKKNMFRHLGETHQTLRVNKCQIIEWYEKVQQQLIIIKKGGCL